MQGIAIVLPERSCELAIRSLGDGRYVIKNLRTGDFLQLGPEEHFLLMQLDGVRTAQDVCEAFTDRFQQALSEADLTGFLQMAETQGLLEARTSEQGVGREEYPNSSPSSPPHVPRSRPGTLWVARRPQQSLLYWRKKLLDPDRLFDWLAPRIWFFWTRGFLAVSAGMILLAAVLMWANRHELAASFLDVFGWETVVLACVTLLVVTTLHEFAHGLTCKHYGGEVHEIGFLLMFFMPCLYCNVSEAWFFREKSRRLWVTFAGGYFELLLWAIAVITWRLTVPDTLIHHIALIVLSLCGVQTLFNFNPLVKLDGYYLLSDWLDVPNLHQRGTDRFKEHLRRWLWGASPPTSEPRGRTLFAYGLISWLYGLAFLALVLWGMFWFMGDRWGVIGMSAVTAIGLVSTRGMMKDISVGEARRMLTQRHKRLAGWLAVLAGVTAVLVFVKIDDRVSGRFVVRPAVRSELRARASGFVKQVHVDEGDRVSAGAVVAILEIPDLDSRVSQKQAEIREAQACLRLLQIGARPEQLAQQRQRVKRATTWRDLGQHDLDRMRQAFAAELASIDKKIAACQVEVEVAQQNYARAKTLVGQKAISVEELQKSAGNYRVGHAHLQQAEAERRARQAQGTLEAETELERRQHQLEDAESALALLEAGSRPEQVEAARARLARLEEEARNLEQLRGRLDVCSPVAGLVVTPRLREKTGLYVQEGDVIGVVEEPAGSDIEITLAEQDVSRIEVGLPVALKARALPFEVLQTKVGRIAPAAGHGEVQSTVTVYCRSGHLPRQLRPGMTGTARVYSGRRPIGAVLVNKLLRFVRTEFWLFW
jgi:multidrug efflux pump subunit AcrA (membrane-fusion protein)